MTPAIVLLILVVFAPAVAAQGPADSHRAAIARYLTASRTREVIDHFILPIGIRGAAVDRWGFDGMTLDADTILEMELAVDRRALEQAVVDVHVRHITAADATAIANFYETPNGQRYLHESIGGMLPSTDPPARQGPSELSTEDRAAFAAFLNTPLAGRLKAAEAAAVTELMRAVDAAADDAIRKYVRARGLPNTRRGD